MVLHNKKDKALLLQELMAENFRRVTLSFYRYVEIADPAKLRDELYIKWSALQVFGRIYLAKEGINAQLSIPEQNFEQLRNEVNSYAEFQNVPFKIAIEDDGKSFYKLAIKVKKQIVADGLPAGTYDVSNVGNHLSAEEWNAAMEEKNTVVVDMRNHYESEIGYFEGAVCPDADTFKEALRLVKEQLHGKEEKKILLYCTGGIRCEKASSYLKHHGFQDVNQLLGGIIDYVQTARRKNLDIKFRGKNFVFDERLGETVTDTPISTCHQCGKECDTHQNCANNACHLLFLQCAECHEKFEGCCTPRCQEIIHLPLEEQKKLRKGTSNAPGVYKSRLRPKLPELIEKQRSCLL